MTADALYFICIFLGLQLNKGKGTQKHKWILSKNIWKTAHFDANCMKIRFLVFKILQFYVFKMEAAILKWHENRKLLYSIYFSKACINIQNLEM